MLDNTNTDHWSEKKWDRVMTKIYKDEEKSLAKYDKKELKKTCKKYKTYLSQTGIIVGWALIIAMIETIIFFLIIKAM